jgi:hypothetical protein
VILIMLKIKDHSFLTIHLAIVNPARELFCTSKLNQMVCFLDKLPT